MTYEEMLAFAERIAVDLTNAGYGNAEVLKDEARPGDPIPIGLEIDGEPFILELNVM